MTLRETIATYNFRDINENQVGMYHEDTLIIRIYFGEVSDWFEFGINDFDYEDQRDKKVEKIISKKILDTEVRSFHCSNELNLFVIHLQEK